MMIGHLILIFSVLTGAVSAHSADALPLLVRSTIPIEKWTGLSSGSYEDIRVDYNLDGKIDYWRIKEKNLVVEINFTLGSVSKYSVKRFINTSVEDVEYTLKNGKLVLTTAVYRPQKVFGFSEPDDKSCSTDNLAANISELQTYVEGIAVNAANKASESLIDPDCFEKSEDASIKLIEVISSYISGTGKFRNFKKCMKSEILNTFLEGKVENPALFASKVRARYQQDVKNLSQNPDLHSPVLVCHASANKDPLTFENGKISFNSTAAMSDSDYSKKFTHEVWHRLGVEKETDLHALEHACEEIAAGKEPKNLQKKSVAGELLAANNGLEKDQGIQLSQLGAQEAQKNQSNSSSASEMGSAKPMAKPNKASDATTNLASSSKATIPKSMTLAQAGIPDMAKQSADITPNRGSTPEVAYAASKSATQGILKAANLLVGSSVTPALATTTGSVRRGVASVSNSEIASSGRAAGGKESAAKVLTRTNAGTLKKGERITEEILLSDESKSQQPAARTTSGRTPSAQPSTSESVGERSVTGARSPANVPSTNSNGGSETRASTGLASGGNTSVSSGVVSRSAAPSSSRPRGRANRSSVNSNARAPASTQQLANKEELITFFRNSEYQSVKSKLEDSTFENNLAEQGVSILNSSGQTWGAQRGSTIFMDTGDKFVQQR